KKVAYTIDSDWKNFFEGDGSSYIVDTNSGSLNAIAIGNTTKYINITSENIAKFTQDALVYASKLTKNDGSKEAEGESLTFDNLELGYYLVYPQGATDILEGNASICSITSTTPNATVNIKAEYPTIEKEVDDANAEVGQLVTFTITGLVPNTKGFDSYTYKITDTMSAGLKLTEATADFNVLFGDSEIDVKPVYSDNGFTLTFDMTKYQDYVGKVITVTYKVLVTEEAVNSQTTKNSATLTYSNNPKTDETSTTPPVEEYVYSSEINVIKVDGEDEETKLAGASFVLKNGDDKFYQALDKDKKVITNVTNTKDVVDVNWVEKQEDATLLVTDEAGIITFEGVENGTYYLVEVDAPEGYNKLTSPVTVKVGYSNEDETNLGNVAVSHSEIVKNNSGTALPETGGMGTKIFMVAGSILTIIPIIVYLVNKQMNEEQSVVQE
ncbi:MAG: SpaH/EbpB family LPXTG-anchored major pilin, partial [Bacilli bacterium]|nr:SpaH/EbpB family LPXTG-anchored major pilin [Bacilli bacterium]